VTSWSLAQNHAAILEVYFTGTKNGLKCKLFMLRLFANRIFWHAAVCKLKQVYDITLMKHGIPPTWRQ